MNAPGSRPEKAPRQDKKGTCGRKAKGDALRVLLHERGDQAHDLHHPGTEAAGERWEAQSAPPETVVRAAVVLPARI